MKTLLLTLIFTFFTFIVFAQQDSIQTTNQEFKELIETSNKDSVNIVTKDSKKNSSEKDTVQIRIGNHNVEIISDGNNTNIDVEKIEDFKSKWEDNNTKEEHHVKTTKRKRKKKFDGHWGGVDFGGNQLWDTDYSLYPAGTPAFLDTKPEKSFEFNINFAEYSFGFGSYVGIVTGLGLNFNDYKFKNRYTIVKDENGIIQPKELPEGDFRKSKLSTGYLYAPLLLEIQIPGNHGKDRLFIAGGLIGGVKIGEHTKTKIGKEKLKDKGEFNLAPVRWGYTAKIGFQDMGIYATYYNTPLFEDGKGPTTTPLTVGLTFDF